MASGDGPEDQDAAVVESGSFNGISKNGKRGSADEHPPQEVTNAAGGSSMIQSLLNFNIFTIISKLFDIMSQAKVQGQDLPDKERLQQQLQAAQNVVKAQQKASSLKERAKKAVDPKERRRLLQESYDKEIEAHGQSKHAKRLQSGAWQGAAGGAGIGTTVGMGLGGVVGALVGGLVSIPTLTLGGLIGAGVGGVHGPFVKLDKSKEQKPQSEEEARAQVMKEADALDQAVEKGASTVPEPPKFDDEDGQPQNADERPHGVVRPHSSTPGAEGVAQTPRKKPKKLEVRSGNEQKDEQKAESEKRKKKPRKLERRSSSATAEVQ